MAIINQSPSNQTGVAVSGLSFSVIAISGSPTRQNRKIVGSPSVEVTLGNTGAPSLPTIGQIWPPGIPVVGTSTSIDPVIYAMIFS